MNGAAADPMGRKADDIKSALLSRYKSAFFVIDIADSEPGGHIDCCDQSVLMPAFSFSSKCRVHVGKYNEKEEHTIRVLFFLVGHQGLEPRTNRL